MRLQRALARSGVASRRAADALVAEGRVTVNGAPAEVGQVVNPGRDTIAVDGQPIARVAAREWLVLHKPAGVLTTRSDPEGRPTVYDLVPDRPGLTYVGRLDYMTEGVLLFTTDGDAAHRLTHPSRAVERTYIAVVRGNAPAAVRALRQGIELEDGPVEASAVEARPLGNRRWEFELTIAEGRNREVRRVCEALDLVVERLARVRFGPVRLGVLPLGEVRPLNASERRVIDALTESESPLLGGAGDELRAVGRDGGRRPAQAPARDERRPAAAGRGERARPERARPERAAPSRGARGDAEYGRPDRARPAAEYRGAEPRGRPHAGHPEERARPDERERPGPAGAGHRAPVRPGADRGGDWMRPTRGASTPPTSDRAPARRAGAERPQPDRIDSEWAWAGETGAAPRRPSRGAPSDGREPSREAPRGARGAAPGRARPSDRPDRAARRAGAAAPAPANLGRRGGYPGADGAVDPPAPGAPRARPAGRPRSPARRPHAAAARTYPSPRQSTRGDDDAAGAGAPGGRGAGAGRGAPGGAPGGGAGLHGGTAAHRPAHRRPRAARGRARAGEDAHRAHARRDHQHELPAHPVHARPAPGRRGGHAGVRPGHRAVLGEARADLRERDPRRRDQPRPGQGAVGAARGDAGEAGHDRRPDLPARRAVPRARHAEPDRAGGDVPAPEAQLDRFMLKLRVGYPTRDEEKEIMRRMSGGAAIDVSPVAGPTQILDARRRIAELYVDERIVDYIVDIVHATRAPREAGLADLAPLIEFGASPRATIALAQASRAHAFLRGRTYVTPDDVKSIAPDVLRHRVLTSFEADAEEVTSDDVVARVLARVESP
jgi:pseudouridine synthase